MKWTRMLGGAFAVSAALLVPAAGATAQVPGQCASSATDCTPSGPAGPPAGNVNVDQPAGPSAGDEDSGTRDERATDDTRPGVLDNTEEQGAPVGTAVDGSDGGAVGRLAVTGGDVVQLVALGVGSIAVGTLLMRRGRRGRPVAT